LPLLAVPFCSVDVPRDLDRGGSDAAASKFDLSLFIFFPSTTRLTTGIACLDDDQLSLSRTGTAWESRKTEIPGGFQTTLIALAGPLLMSELGRVRSPSGPEFQSRHRKTRSPRRCAPTFCVRPIAGHRSENPRAPRQNRQITASGTNRRRQNSLCSAWI